MNTNLTDLVSISREYGSDPGWVVAGGGNTSLKLDNVLYVKASGFPLATIEEGGFARMDRLKLAAIWDAGYPEGEDAESVAERERLVLADMMAARMPGEEKRPSVEALLHDLLPWPLIVHLHPTLINGLTCGVRGEEIAGELFSQKMEWIRVCNPGYVLAKKIRDALEIRRGKGLKEPDFIFLANHGVFVGGGDSDEIREKYSRLKAVLEKRLQRRPETMPTERKLPEEAAALNDIAEGFFGKDVQSAFIAGGELDRYLKNKASAAPLIGALTPDHIVYAGPGALYLEAGNTPEDWKSAAESYSSYWGKPPNIILLGGEFKIRGALVAAAGKKALDNAVLLLKNALEVIAYSESFGGPQLLEERFARFIVNWEVESYRSKLASS